MSRAGPKNTAVDPACARAFLALELEAGALDDVFVAVLELPALEPGSSPAA
jgi:hypothetical protein